MEIEQKANKVIRPASIYTLSAEETNQITTELQNVITAGGLTPSNSTLTQVRDAIDNLISDATTGEWQKPEDWLDIQSGALDNSIYLLVGHSADFSTYPKFEFSAQLSSSTPRTYDVYVDGLKVATTEHNTTTTLTWATLYANGDVTDNKQTTYPANLVQHIVRVTPTNASSEIQHIQMRGSYDNGLLWAHFEISNSLILTSFSNVHSKILEAVTAKDDTIKAISLYEAFNGTSSLVYVPTIDGSNVVVNVANAFYSAAKIKEIRLKNMTTGDNTGAFRATPALRYVRTENASVSACNGTLFSNSSSLQQLPNFAPSSSSNPITISNVTSLKPTMIDLSIYPNVTKAQINGTSSANFCDGIKGVIFSNSAPFTGSSPQINVTYTGMDRNALVRLFKSMPTVSASQVCNITGATGAADLTAEDLAIATAKGWTITR